MKVDILKWLMSTSFTLLLAIGAVAQIVNVESLRKKTDTTGIAGGVALDGSYLDNAKVIYTLEFVPHVQYKWARDLLLVVGDYKVTKSDDVDFKNASYFHVRFNHEFTDFFRWETFGQVQHNKITKVNYRILTGTGPRFKLIGKDFFRMYLGITPMYQYESLIDQEQSIESLVRLSNYVSFTVVLSENAELYSTSYYQPALNRFSDYRFYNEQKLNVHLFRNLDLTFKTVYTWDNRPAEGAPPRTLELKTGLEFSF